jgi:hypothetical protein
MVKTESRLIESIALTEVQARMLLFFAGQRDEPCGDPRTTQALVSRALLALDISSGRYRITDLGQRVATSLVTA